MQIPLYRPTVYDPENKTWVPNPAPRPDLEPYYAQGLLRKEQLKHGKYYKGHCRNAEVARWNAKENLFRHVRHKWGSPFEENIPHPADDDGHDVFICLEEVIPTHEQEVYQGF